MSLINHCAACEHNRAMLADGLAENVRLKGQLSALELDRLSIEYWRDDGNPLPTDAFGRQCVATRAALQQAVEAMAFARDRILPLQQSLARNRAVELVNAAISAGRKILDNSET